MGKKGILAALFGGAGGKKSGNSRKSKSRSKHSNSKGSVASKAKAKTKTTPKAKRSDVRKIYKTTDGYFSKNNKMLYITQIFMKILNNFP